MPAIGSNATLPLGKGVFGSGATAGGAPPARPRRPPPPVRDSTRIVLNFGPSVRGVRQNLRNRLGLTGRQCVAVQQPVGPGGHRQAPILAVRVGQLKVRMKPNRDRHGLAAQTVDAGADFHRSVFDTIGHGQRVRKRELLHVLRHAKEVQLHGDPCRPGQAEIPTAATFIHTFMNPPPNLEPRTGAESAPRSCVQ